MADNKRAILVLEDGSVYEGLSFGAEADACGEVVFNTSMAGYQEMLTDPSYAGQIVVPTYPLIGNYGVNQCDIESSRIQVSGFVVREECLQPSHYLKDKTIHQYLSENGIPGICGIDTRAITRRLRSCGVMKGILTTDKTPQQALGEIKAMQDYGSIDFVRQVSTKNSYQFGSSCEDCHSKFDCFPPHESHPPLCGFQPDPRFGNVPIPDYKYHVAVFDCGLKYNILRILNQLGCRVTAVPCTTPAADILTMDPDGILFSPGPGNPELLDYIVDNVRQLVDKKPIMGICLGAQLIGRAFGAKNFKLKFGHRGGNHPVKDLINGRVHITAQNHGYALDPDTVKNGLEVSHINLNDGTVEGVRHTELPIFAIQYHSEASPGPLDNTYLFEKFIDMVRRNR